MEITITKTKIQLQPDKLLKCDLNNGNYYN